MVSDRSNGIDWRNGIATKLGVVIALVIAASAIGWGWNYGLGQERTYEQEARQAHADQTENGCYQVTHPEVQGVAVEKTDSKPCTPDEKAKQENDNRRDYADLVAQRSSALWAKIMGIAALIGMGLSFVGVALVWTTFRETRNANQIAQSALDLETRPFVIPDGQFVHRMGAKDKAWVEFAWINIGKSPAVIVSSTVNRDIGHGAGDDTKGAAQVILLGSSQYTHNGRSFALGRHTDVALLIEYTSVLNGKTYITKAEGAIFPPNCAERTLVNSVAWASVICEEKKQP